jgi:peptidyl-prolyl cis-trans isomerase SurA
MERANMSNIFRAILPAIVALGLGLAMPPVVVTPAFAQSAIATVNGEPITGRDVEQRMRIMQIIFRQPLSRPAAIQELIDEKVKVTEGRRMGMRPTPAFLEDSIGRLASANKQSNLQFEQNLVRAGIDPEALKAKLGNEAIWGEMLRQRARSNNISNSELDAELERRTAKGDAKVTDYVVRQVVFVVPPGVNPGAREAAANAARGRFTDCDTGVDYLRTLPDVAVRERVGRTSNEVGKPINDLLTKTQIGRLTAPYRSSQGVEMLALCERKDREDRIALRNAIEQEMISKRVQGGSTQYLSELRSKVEIRR